MKIIQDHMAAKEEYDRREKSVPLSSVRMPVHVSSSSVCLQVSLSLIDNLSMLDVLFVAFVCSKVNVNGNAS